MRKYFLFPLSIIVLFLCFQNCSKSPLESSNKNYQSANEPLAQNSQTAFALYVDPNGPSYGDGSSNRPFNKIVQAQDYIRSQKLTAQSDVVVHLAPGRYLLEKPLVFYPEDGGNDQYRVIYRGSEKGPTIISGGREITNWHSVSLAGRKNVYRAVYKGPAFRQLNFGSFQGVRARFPNRLTAPQEHPSIIRWDAKDRYLVIPHIKDKNDNDIIHEDLLSQNIEIHVPLDDTMAIMRIEGLIYPEDGIGIIPRQHERDLIFYRGFVEEQQSDYYVNYPPQGTTPGTYIEQHPGAHGFWLENSLNFLDEPGEWFASSNGEVHEIFVMAPDGVDPNHSKIVVPSQIETLVMLLGKEDKKVKNLHFLNIRFADTNYIHRYTNDIYPYVANNGNAKVPYPYNQAGPSTQGYMGRFNGHPHTMFQENGNMRFVTYAEDPAAVYFSHTESCSIENSLFEDLGAGALRIQHENSNIMIKGNAFSNIASFGVLAMNYTPQDQAPSKDEHFLIRSLHIRDNIFSHVGFQFNGVPIEISENNHKDVHIEHNTVKHAPFYGIKALLGHSTYVIGNRIHNPLARHTDGGAFWFSNSPRAPRDGFMKVQRNYVTHARASGWINRGDPDRPLIAAGLYVDGGKNMEISHNIFEDMEIGLYYLCPYEGLKIVFNHMANYKTVDMEYPCDFDNDPDNVARPEPLPLTSDTLNHQLAPIPEVFNPIKSKSGIRSPWKEMWHRY